jgi:ketosteroid isomerase-like protein
VRLRRPRASRASTEEEIVPDTATRTPQEVLQHHAEVHVAGDLDGIVSDYSDDAVVVTSEAA